MTVSRLRDIPGIGVDRVGDAADAAADPRFLRLENLDTDLRPPQVALEATHAAVAFFTELGLELEKSGRRESNPHSQLGRLRVWGRWLALMQVKRCGLVSVSDRE